MLETVAWIFKQQYKKFLADGIHWLVHQWHFCLKFFFNALPPLMSVRSGFQLYVSLYVLNLNELITWLQYQSYEMLNMCSKLQALILVQHLHNMPADTDMKRLHLTHIFCTWIWECIYWVNMTRSLKLLIQINFVTSSCKSIIKCLCSNIQCFLKSNTMFIVP